MQIHADRLKNAVGNLVWVAHILAESEEQLAGVAAGMTAADMNSVMVREGVALLCKFTGTCTTMILLRGACTHTPSVVASTCSCLHMHTLSLSHTPAGAPGRGPVLREPE